MGSEIQSRYYYGIKWQLTHVELLKYEWSFPDIKFDASVTSIVYQKKKQHFGELEISFIFCDILKPVFKCEE